MRKAGMRKMLCLRIGDTVERPDPGCVRNSKMTFALPLGLEV
jgi:hypothetical protein